MKNSKNSLFIPFIIFAILILIIAFSLKNIHILNNNSKAVVHAFEVKMALANNLSLLKDIETGSRGFILTGNNEFKAPFDLAKPEIQKNILQLQTLLENNPIQLFKLDSLKQLIDLKITINVELIKIREQSGLNKAVEIISTERGKKVMDDIRKLSKSMLEVEQKILNDRNKISSQSYFLAQIFAVLGGILSILIAIFLMIINNKSLKLKKNILKSEEKLKQVLESAPDGIVVIDNNRKMQIVNVQAEKLFGYTREEMIGKEVEMLIPDRFRSEHPANERKFIADQKTRLMGIGKELFGKRKDGSEFSIEISLVPLHSDDEKEGLTVLATIRDITEIKRIAKEISDYKNTLDEFAIVAITDQKGIIDYVNDNFCKISKYSREELIGQDHRIVNSGYHPKDFIQGIWITIAKGKMWKGEIKNKAKDGTIYWVDTTIVPFLDKHGKPNKYVAVRTDITEQKRITEELKEAKEVAELAKILAEEEKAKAENALQSKQQFLANMSHEIRTPMNAILGFTKVLFKTDLVPNQKEYLDAIKTSGDGLLVLINDILDLAKVDAGKMTFEQTPFKMQISISAILQIFDLKIQEKSIELVKEYDNRIPEVLKGDAVRLNQILLNLMSNALKFTAKGKITIAVRLLTEDKETAIIEFAISDTGTGIPEDKLKSIFDNFQQATSSTSRLFGGTGLGLAICKQLIEKQGGTIIVKSKVDEGSTFSFTLNFQKSNEESKIKNEEIELEKEKKVIKVLLVEDIKLNQLLMKIILEDFKFKYDIADNGKIAIEKMQTETYDIILMDLQMPEMNGFEATEYIRNTLKSKIPIIALTADVTTVDLEKCKAAGMNDYVSKPLDERILYTKIIDLLIH